MALFEIPKVEDQTQSIGKAGGEDVTVLSNGSVATSEQQAESTVNADPGIGANQTKRQHGNF